MSRRGLVCAAINLVLVFAFAILTVRYTGPVGPQFLIGAAFGFITAVLAHEGTKP